MVKVIIDGIEIEDLSEIEAPEETVEIIKKAIFS